MPINRSPAKPAKLSSSITELQQTRISQGFSTAAQEGRKGIPAETVLVAPLVTLTLRSELAGSRCGNSKDSSVASVQVKKKGFVKPLASVVRAALLIRISLIRPLSGPVVCSLT